MPPGHTLRYITLRYVTSFYITLHYITFTCIDSSFDMIHWPVTVHSFFAAVRAHAQNRIHAYFTCVHGIHTSCGILKRTCFRTSRYTHTSFAIHACIDTHILEQKRLRSTLQQHHSMHSKIEQGKIKHLSCQRRSRAAVVPQIALLQVALAAAARVSCWTRLCTFPWWQGVTSGRWTHPSTPQRESSFPWWFSRDPSQARARCRCYGWLNLLQMRRRPPRCPRVQYWHHVISLVITISRVLVATPTTSWYQIELLSCFNNT